jgi:hypothetical protein
MTVCIRSHIVLGIDFNNDLLPDRAKTVVCASAEQVFQRSCWFGRTRQSNNVLRSPDCAPTLHKSGWSRGRPTYEADPDLQLRVNADATLPATY